MGNQSTKEEVKITEVEPDTHLTVSTATLILLLTVIVIGVLYKLYEKCRSGLLQELRRENGPAPAPAV